ncbi:hypothetical protein DUNSADRAFT_12634 [Dunaliella salina]|uniref:RNA polymerase sigma-70 region 2 domain-containing protein n=1 Tax=Dunaliella salina TaxID=3046 RepID=A0ABQ7H3M3_DUNSA|nr:hypothetical protein DUNSADRAFT_12634 [Dunaliella salina]|eukprot:KAF5841469.1 hypothetical protein DUNSADRAFT_12634 [Dunaliella salina]
MRLHLFSPYNISSSARILASTSSTNSLTCCPPRASLTPRFTPCRSAGSATLDVAPTNTQHQTQQSQQQQQQQYPQWHLPTKSISESDTLDTHQDFAAPLSHEDDMDQLKLLQRELEGCRLATAKELAQLQQQDSDGTTSVSSAPGRSKRRAGTTPALSSRSSSSSSSSAVSEPSTSSSSLTPTKEKRLGARSRSTGALQLGSHDTFASSTKRTHQRRHQKQRPATLPGASGNNSALRNSRDAFLGVPVLPTPSADRIHDSGRRARVLSRAEEGMLATVARDGVLIEQVAKQLASILKRQPDNEELAVAMKSEPWELEQRKQASLAARRLLLKANRGLVAKVVHQSIAHQQDRGGSSLTFEDSMEAGMTGMLKAILKFEPESGFKLSTYAVNWIRQELSRAQMQADLIRVPDHFKVEAGQLMRAHNELLNQKQQKPTNEEVCHALGWSRLKYAQVNQATLMKHAASQALSLESSLDDENAHSLDAAMSMALSNPRGEDGWKFSSGSTMTAEVEREEQLARDMEALLEQVVRQPEAQQAQHAQQQPASAAEQQLSATPAGGSTAASAASSMRVRKPGRKSKREMQAAQSGAAPAEGHAPTAAAAAGAAAPDPEAGSEQQGQAMQQEGLSPLHVEILRLRLGLMAGRDQEWDEERVKQLTEGFVRPRRETRVTTKSLTKRARTQEVLEQRAAQGQAVSVHSIAAKFGMTPRRVQQAEREALQWLQRKYSGQIADILRAHAVEPGRAAGMLPRSAGGASKKA